MKSLRTFVMTAGILTLGGCTMYDTYSEIDALNEAQAVGSPFTQALTAEYKEFANNQMNKQMDYPDALHFARKGLAAAAGESVMPEPVSDWNLTENYIKELNAARGRLIVTYDMGAREIAPATAARAQVQYDCWVEAQEENLKNDANIECKNGFLEAMNELEGLVQKAPQAVESVDSAPMIAEEAMYLVFFNWNETELSSTAGSVLDAVATEILKNPPSKINIVGHADTSGSDDYNIKLGLKRANKVRDALIKRGVSANMLSAESRGESELLVATPDGVREPANRRVNISFQ